MKTTVTTKTQVSCNRILVNLPSCSCTQYSVVMMIVCPENKTHYRQMKHSVASLIFIVLAKNHYNISSNMETPVHYKTMKTRVSRNRISLTILVVTLIA